MRNKRSRCRSAFAILVMALVYAGEASAQLPSASTRALGMGENYTAAARGYAAISWNPALLALPHGPRVSFTALPVRAVAGLAPISLQDLKRFEGITVPDAVREQWLRAIELKGGEQGTGGGDATYLAAQVGRFGVQVASSLRATGNLSPGAAELIFFGNAGRTGEPRAIQLAGSHLGAHAVSTAAISYALPIKSGGVPIAVGVTAKYMIGHFLLFGEDRGSAISDDAALNVNFPVVGTRTDELDLDGGNGFGLDIGVATQGGAYTFGATLKNAINTFSWDQTKLNYRQGTARFDDEAKSSDFSARTLESAPENLKRAVEAATFQPLLAAGIAYHAANDLTISSDVRVRLGDTQLADEARLHAGAGLEFRGLSMLPLRAGAAVLNDGFQVSGGFGLNVGRVQLAGSVMRRKTELGTQTVTMITLLSFGDKI